MTSAGFRASERLLQRRCVRGSGWRRGRLRKAIAASVSAVVGTLVAVAVAGADPSYLLIAQGDVPVNSGGIVVGGLQWTPTSVAVRSDGVIAFATGPKGE